MNESAREILAQNVTALTKAQKLNQPALASKANITQRTVGHMMNGTVGSKIDSIEAVAKALGVAPWQLLIPRSGEDKLTSEELVSVSAQLLEAAHGKDITPLKGGGSFLSKIAALLVFPKE